MQEIEDALFANGLQRSLCILGGEPLCENNLQLTTYICETIRIKYPKIKIYIWTGYLIEELWERNDPQLNNILNGKNADVIVDGPFMKNLKDLTLKMRGSSNQRIIYLNN